MVINLTSTLVFFTSIFFVKSFLPCLVIAFKLEGNVRIAFAGGILSVQTNFLQIKIEMRNLNPKVLELSPTTQIKILKDERNKSLKIMIVARW